MLAEHWLWGLELCIRHPSLCCIFRQLEFIHIVVFCVVLYVRSFLRRKCFSWPSHVTVLSLVAASQNLFQVLDLSLAREGCSCSHDTCATCSRAFRRVVDLSLLLDKHFLRTFLEQLWLLSWAFMTKSKAFFEFILALLRFQIVN